MRLENKKEFTLMELMHELAELEDLKYQNLKELGNALG